MLHRKRNVVALIVCALCSLLAQGCGDSGAGYSLSDLQTVIPINVGSSWTYIDIVPSSLPMFPDDSELVVAHCSGYVDSAKTRVYALNGFIGEGDSARYYESVTQTQYRRYRDDDNGKRVVVATLLQTPIRRGNRWFFNGADISAGYAEIANPDTTIRLSSGTFADVISVRQLTPNGNRWFIKPMTGIVYETHVSDVMVTREFVDKNF